MADDCTHLDQVGDVRPSSGGCEEIQSYEPGEDWWWCYADEAGVAVDGPSYSHP